MEAGQGVSKVWLKGNEHSQLSAGCTSDYKGVKPKFASRAICCGGILGADNGGEHSDLTISFTVLRRADTLYLGLNGDGGGR